MYHFGYEPMNMNCHCTERVCRWCVQVGNITNCPMCRKYKKKPFTDEKWKKTNVEKNAQLTEKCLGCDADLPLLDVSLHEKNCTKYRDYLDRVYVDMFQTYRDKTREYEVELQSVTERTELQEQEIEELEEQVDGFKITTALYEAETRVYVFEQQNVLGTLNKLTRPLHNLSKKLQHVQNTVEGLKQQIKNSRENHRIFTQKRRRVGLDEVVSETHEVVTPVSVLNGDDTDDDLVLDESH